jgi:hypothetical protein
MLMARCGVAGSVTVDKKITFVKFCEKRRVKKKYMMSMARSTTYTNHDCCGCKYGEKVAAGLYNAPLPDDVIVDKNLVI